MRMDNDNGIDNMYNKDKQVETTKADYVPKPLNGENIVGLYFIISYLISSDLIQ